jgi:NADH:ubiquinone oxidoreductase subunit D
MELERIADHMLAYASTLELAGCPSAAARVWSDRELVLDASRVVTGQRLVHDLVSIGGLTTDAPEAWNPRLQRVSGVVQAAVRDYVREAEDLEPLERLEDLAPVHLEDMRGWGLTGPLVRSMGVARDARVDGRCTAYRGWDVPAIGREAGDAMARTELRLLEISASARVLTHLSRTMPGGLAQVDPPELIPKGSALGVVEGPRGELLCMVVSDGTHRPRRVRFRSPDMAHAAALSDLLIGAPEDDVALAVASIDICAGGVDR